jgi:1-acyl-sn-glycerol-3-phosphate acyltransferase
MVFPILPSHPLHIARQILTLAQVHVFYEHQERVPRCGALLVVSNHRSVMDAFVLMVALNRPIAFACHHYMGQVPLLREIVTQMGCFPLDDPQHRQQSFFRQATQCLQSQQAVGIFPEGGLPMVQVTPQNQLATFQRGFAHVALRTLQSDITILPVAIAPQDESTTPFLPFDVFRWFDPSEPLFQRQGWHPLALYHRVDVRIGQPLTISAREREHYRGKQAKSQVDSITHYCQQEIQAMLDNG